MSFEEELEYVKDAFDTYEALGFKETFNSPYAENETYGNTPFMVLGRCSYEEDNFDLEVLPMWHILFPDGQTLDAYPEEICQTS